LDIPCNGFQMGELGKQESRKNIRRKLFSCLPAFLIEFLITSRIQGIELARCEGLGEVKC